MAKRVQAAINELNSSESDIEAALKDSGPLKTGELQEVLGYSSFNFLITKMIGDNNGQWDDSPHQLALSDMIDDGRVRWWYDDHLNVNYGWFSDRGVPCVELCGDRSPGRIRVVEFLDKVANSMGLPMYDKEGNDSGNTGRPAVEKLAAAPCPDAACVSKEMWCWVDGDGWKKKVVDKVVK